MTAVVALADDYDETVPDAHVIAQQIVTSRTKRDKTTPKQADLERFITGISYDHTTGAAGAPTLTITMLDPEWHILDSGFYDTDEDGRLDELDLNYPDGGRWWWRLHQVSPQQDRSVQLVFVPRIISELMTHFGPLKASRAKRTRAEFLQMLCGAVDDSQGTIEFYSQAIDIKQKIANSGPTVGTDSSSKVTKPKAAAKHTGIGANLTKLTVKGAKMTRSQAQIANIILQAGQQASAPHNAILGAIYAAIGESGLGSDVGSEGGVFQTTFNPAAYSGGNDTSAQATGWYTGGECFNAGGGIKCAQKGDPVWMIANEVENNKVWIDNGGTGRWADSYTSSPAEQASRMAEVEAIVGGGGKGVNVPSTETVTETYYFQVNKNEDYWAAMNRLAQEVAWELIVDGNRIYYDKDRTLINQKPAAIFNRRDPRTYAWNFDWVNREIATNFQIEVASRPMEFSAGEVVQVENFGPASTGSTMGVPGCWLISEVQRNSGDVYSTFTLVQPAKAKPEPAPKTTTKQLSSGPKRLYKSLGNVTPGTAEAAYAAAQKLAGLYVPYVWGGGHGTLDRNPSGLDCSGSVSWVLVAAGFTLPNGCNSFGTLGAVVSGDFRAGVEHLVSGPGNEMTIYAKGTHVFMRIHPQGLADMQGNTVSPLIHEHGFDFFPWNTPGCGGDGGPSPSSEFWQVHYPGT